VADYTWDDEYYFRVQLMPMPDDAITEAELPLVVSNVDLVHPNLRAQQVFAKGIWNNMFREPDSRLVTWKDIMDSGWHRPADEYLK
jgi:hypothetical protein